VANIVDKTGTIKDQQDITPMGLASLVVDMDLEDEVLPSILSKVVRGMK
jgi:hypothetical protein